MKLSRAWLCCNCDQISANASACDCCGSIALLHLEKLLNREPQDESEKTIQELIETAYKKGQV